MKSDLQYQQRQQQQQQQQPQQKQKPRPKDLLLSCNQQTTTNPKTSTFRSTPTLHLPRAQMTSIFEGQPSKTRPFPWRKVLLVLGTYTLIFQFPIFFRTTQLPIYQGFPRLSTRFSAISRCRGTSVPSTPKMTPLPNSKTKLSGLPERSNDTLKVEERLLPTKPGDFLERMKKKGPGGLGYKL